MVGMQRRVKTRGHSDFVRAPGVKELIDEDMP